MAYMALPGEVETKDIIRQALKAGKRVFLPRMVRRTRRLRIYQIQNLSRDLQKGSFRIREPQARRNRLGQAKKMDLILIPGLGFDRRGGRLGRGEGYFDRFLKKATRARRIGLAFRYQVIRKIPRSKHDVRIHQLITD